MRERLIAFLSEMSRAEQTAGGDADALAAIEAGYESAVGEYGRIVPFLLQRNGFRVAHADAMRIRRPRLLFDHRLNTELNFQTVHAVLNADVVFLMLTDRRIDERFVACVDPRLADIDDLMRALPPGFLPDLYFDYQVCTSGVFLSGMERAPFPTVAGLCHTFMTRKIEQIAKLFDFVLPMSKRFSELMASCVPAAKIVDIPFGFSWGSFDAVVSPGADADRDIDVLLSFDGGAPSAFYGTARLGTERLFAEAKKKFGDRYNFVKATGIAKQEYIELLRRSRIVLNAVGVHGPYNYRSCEAVNAGALLMQYEPRYVTGSQRMEDYLEPDREFVPFDETDFIAKLGRLMADEPARAEIAHAGERRMREEYGYDRQYRRLFSLILSPDRGDWRSRRPTSAEAAYARLFAQLHSVSTREIDTSVLFPPLRDFLEMLNGDDIPAAAMLIPFYERLEIGLREKAFAVVCGRDTAFGISPAHNLKFYDAAFRSLASPSVVDRFNYLALCAANGRIDAEAAKTLVAMLRLPVPIPIPGDNETMRLVRRPAVQGVTDEMAAQAEVTILNLPRLAAGGDPAACWTGARDFMRLWLYVLLSLTEPAGGWRKEAEDILAAYPLEVPLNAASDSALRRVG
jgi:hypothetical protein